MMWRLEGQTAAGKITSIEKIKFGNLELKPLLSGL
jgi:hypothetical protein